MKRQTTLLTFIGRTYANRAYTLARYRFDDGVEFESKLFAAAATAWLQRTGRAPDRLLIVGTPTSGWDVLMELVERLAPAHADAALEWAIPVSVALAAGPVDPVALREFEDRFSAALGVRVNLALTQNDGDLVFDTLDGSIAAGERVILDITHSYRSMPVHALVALGAMRWLKGVELADIIYGSLDERNADGTSSAKSLGSTSALARATPALAQLALVDDVGSIAPYFATRSAALGQHLADTQRLESLMQFDQAGARRGQALGELRRFDGAPTIGTVAAKLSDTLESLNHGKGAQGLIDRARRALDRRDFMRAVGLANEALALRVVELHDLRSRATAELRAQSLPDGDYYRTLNQLARERLESDAQRGAAPRPAGGSASLALRTLREARNAVMHAGTGLSAQKAPIELHSQDALCALLAWAFEFFDFLGSVSRSAARATGSAVRREPPTP
jgi:CRISPR-associated Csx2 family protein